MSNDNTPMTPLAAAQAIIDARAKATAGEWFVHYEGGTNWSIYDGGPTIHDGDKFISLDFGKYSQGELDTEFIAAAANHLPEVCEALEAAERRNAKLVELVNSIVSDGVRREMHTRTELARIMGTETHDEH